MSPDKFEQGYSSDVFVLAMEEVLNSKVLFVAKFESLRFVAVVLGT